MTAIPDAATPADGELLADRRRDGLRRSAIRFHDRLARTRLLVSGEARTEVRLSSIDRKIDAAMVAVELLVGVMSGPAVPATLFDGQPCDDAATVRATRAEGDRRRDAWEHLWVLRCSASQFGGRLNRALGASESYGLSRPQARVVLAAVMAMVRLVEDIGQLPVPPDLLELVS